MKNKTYSFHLQTNITPMHYMPEDDIEEHTIDRFDCKCNPKFKREGKALIIIHNPFDKNIPPWQD